ncbi:EF-P beta-lysylation protein EpmB [Larsenimonas rhizosphaerae]|uniref:EF-P beta-lysylation protein EpmB n=1 Tax=Larsenimonas rhizosphaerae TaxID=2944682 RepID=UPI002033C11C|nr:EF-P beta-lysylation protein EpmB [Larsenimonas rhizosphaerae]MCM2132102.1 EF-P beta-lysylation protein EpmB [Larsenimonas rhizosphaerae]
MITRTVPFVQAPATTDWRVQLKQAIRDPNALLHALALEPALLPGAEAGHHLFDVRVPQAYLARMTPGDASDPLLRQVLPLQEETRQVAGFTADPLEEAEHMAAPGIIHKYQGRVLFIVTGACAINCRYCFRRHFPYADNTLSRRQWDTSLEYLRGNDSIREVILSGGDPLSAPDRYLGHLVQQIEAIPHITRLRLHTRLPVVIPDRINDELLDWLGSTRLNKVMVLHINHPNEIDEAVQAACTRLRDAGVTLLNQSVLLEGVNDDEDVLEALSERLFSAGILPYYLHVLDPVAGAAHFMVDDARAKQLMDALKARLPGFLVPHLAREEPGEASKTRL